MQLKLVQVKAVQLKLVHAKELQPVIELLFIFNKLLQFKFPKQLIEPLVVMIMFVQVSVLLIVNPLQLNTPALLMLHELPNSAVPAVL